MIIHGGLELLLIRPHDCGGCSQMGHGDGDCSNLLLEMEDRYCSDGAVNE